MRLHEPAVTLTDLALGIEAAACALLLPGPSSSDPRGRSLQRWFRTFFAATGSASLAGAAVHGLFEDDDDPRRVALWRLALASIAVSSLAGWGIASTLALPPARARHVSAVATVAYAGCLIAISRTNPPYAVAIATYLPALGFLGWAFSQELDRRDERRAAMLGLAGLGLSLAAAGIQLGRVHLHPRWFDHNALYHLVQAIAVAAFFASARAYLAQPETARR
jgi:hydrogenase/urease accessory protein HupE